MSKHNDGGPAFPLPDEYLRYDIGESSGVGMSLRDYFAGQVISDLLNNVTSDGIAVSTIDLKVQAHLAYEMADAMLDERRT